MKKTILLTLTVAGGLYVQTLGPERQDREVKHASCSSCKYSCKKAAGIHRFPQIKLSGVV